MVSGRHVALHGHCCGLPVSAVNSNGGYQSGFDCDVLQLRRDVSVLFVFFVFVFLLLFLLFTAVRISIVKKGLADYLH